MECPEWVKDGQRVRVTARCSPIEDCLIGTLRIDTLGCYIDWDKGPPTCNDVRSWISVYGMRPIDDNDKVSESDCQDCGGTGQYQGLLVIERCKTCNN